MRSETHVRGDISDFLDRRLAARRRGQVERHLEICADCRREWQALVAVRAAVRSTATKNDVPIDLATEVRSALDREDGAGLGRRSPFARRAPLAALAAAAAVAVAVLFLALPNRIDPPSAAADDWQRWTAGRLPLDFESGRPEAIASFFAEKRVDLPTPPALLEIPGYRIVGARVHSLDGRRSAFLVYRNDSNQTLVCQMYRGSVERLPPGGRVVARSGARLYLFRVSGLTQIFWQNGTIACVLVSDITPEELVQIALPKAMMRG
jgi:anti-sigma factor RsiW